MIFNLRMLIVFVIFHLIGIFWGILDPVDAMKMNAFKNIPRIPVRGSSMKDIRGESMKVDEISRTRFRGKSSRWSTVGIPFFYNSKDLFKYGAQTVATYDCLLNSAVEIIRKYACVPIRIFNVGTVCNPPKNFLIKCIQKNRPIAIMVKNAGMDVRTLTNFVWVQHEDSGCWSNLGRDPHPGKNGLQLINISEDCFDLPLIIHEMIHTLGFIHEHNREDRDDYVDIIWDNIEADEDTKREFEKWPDATKDLGKYDILSVMHYDRTSGTRDEHLPTIRVKNRTLEALDPKWARRVEEEFGTLELLSFMDKVKIRSVTRCPGVTEQPGTKEDKIDLAKLEEGVVDIDRKRESTDLRLPYIDCLRQSGFINTRRKVANNTKNANGK